MLGLPDVLEEVETVRHNTAGVLQDVWDGEYVKTCLSTNDHLLLSFYYDELEVANPLGSRRGKHKLGKQLFSSLLLTLFPIYYLSAMFYWMLLNIHPAHRSSLRSIQLLAVGKCTDVKHYGIDAFLRPAIDDMKTLAHKVSFWIVSHTLVTVLLFINLIGISI